MRQFFSQLVVLGCLVFGGMAKASFPFSLFPEAPCGCGRAQASRDANSVLAAEEGLKKCFSCEKIKTVSDIEPYLNVLFSQLPRDTYPAIGNFLHETKHNGQSYEVLLKSLGKRIQQFLEKLHNKA